MKRNPLAILAASFALLVSGFAAAQATKPNIILIMSDDFGYGDSGVYGGGAGRGPSNSGYNEKYASDRYNY